MNVYQEMVEEFHQELGATIGTYPDLRDNVLRAKLVMEEAVETVAAMGFGVTAEIHPPENFEAQWFEPPIATFDKVYRKPHFTDAIDGLCDLIYVVLGAAVTWGIDLDPFFAEVHRANMTKLGGGMREDGKFLKPEGWQGPDHDRILIAQQRNADMWAELEGQVFEDGEFINAAEARHEALLSGEKVA